MDNHDFMVATNQLKVELKKELTSVQKSISDRIDQAVDNAISRKLEWSVNTQLSALKKIESDKPLGLEQLTKRYSDLFGQIEQLKLKRDEGLLYDQMIHIQNRFDEMNSDFLWIKRTLNQLIADKLVETDIDSEELQKLYAMSQLSPEAAAKHINLSKDQMYRILRGDKSKSAIMERHQLKQLFLKAIANIEQNADI